MRLLIVLANIWDGNGKNIGRDLYFLGAAGAEHITLFIVVGDSLKQWGDALNWREEGSGSYSCAGFCFEHVSELL